MGTRSELLPQHRKRIRKEHVNSCTAQPLVVPKKQREAGEANVDQTVQIEQAVCRLPAARAAQRPSTASGTSRTWHHSSGQRRQGPTALGAPSDPPFLSPPRTAVPIGSRCSASIHFTAPISDQIRRTEKHKTGKHDPQKTHRPGRDGQQAHAIIPENKNKPVLSSSATDEQQRGRGGVSEQRFVPAAPSARLPRARRCRSPPPRLPAAPARASPGEGVGMGPAAPSSSSSSFSPPSPFPPPRPRAAAGLTLRAAVRAHLAAPQALRHRGAERGGRFLPRAHGAAAAPPGGRAEPATRRRAAAPPATPPALFAKPLALGGSTAP